MTSLSRILLALTFLGSTYGSAETPAERLALVPTLWSTEKTELEALVRQTSYSPATLYQLQDRLGLFLNFAFRTGNTRFVDESLTLLLGAIPFAPIRNTYTYDPGGAGARFTLPLVPARRMWVNDTGSESLLHSSQFIYLLSRTVKEIAALPEAQRTSKMRQFVSSYAHIVRDHLSHWLFSQQGMFQVKGWGCAPGLFNHMAFLDKKARREFGTSKSYCNAVTDIDLWLIASTAEFLGAARLSPQAVPLSMAQWLSFSAYLKNAAPLVKARLTSTKLRRPSGARVYGLIFDKGAWRDHATNAYSGYEQETFPDVHDAGSNANVTWDIGHSRRFVFVFDSLARNSQSPAERQSWEGVQEGLANQFAFGIFQGDVTRPLFRNYFDGANGWYRVGYQNRAGFGYSPFSRSAEAASAGYCLWTARQPRIGQICESVFQVIEAPTGSPTETFRRENYDLCYHRNYVRQSCSVLNQNDGRSSLLNLLVSAYPNGGL